MVAAGGEDSVGVKMSFTLLKFPLRISTMEHPKNSLFHVMYSAPSVRGE